MLWKYIYTGRFTYSFDFFIQIESSHCQYIALHKALNKALAYGAKITHLRHSDAMAAMLTLDLTSLSSLSADKVHLRFHYCCNRVWVVTFTVLGIGDWEGAGGGKWGRGLLRGVEERCV